MNHPLKGPAVASGLIHLSLLTLVSGVSSLGLSSPLEVRIPIEVITVGEIDAPASQQSMPRTGRIRKDRLRTPGGPSPRENPTASPSDPALETPQVVQTPSRESSVPRKQPPIPLLPPEQGKQALIDHQAASGTAQIDRNAGAAGVGVVASALAVSVNAPTCPSGCGQTSTANFKSTDGYPLAHREAGRGRVGIDDGGLIDGRLLKGGYQVTPRYPESARRAGIEGTALLKLHVLADGGVASVTIERSSGHADLDHAAVQAIRRWRFVPVRKDHRAVAAWAMLPVEFRLKR